MNIPTRRTRSACCPRAASGQAAAAPPTSVMNSRRRMSNMGLLPVRRAPRIQPTTAAPQSVCRKFSLPQGGPQVLEAVLNCS
jgi:hypothetical protein